MGSHRLLELLNAYRLSGEYQPLRDALERETKNEQLCYETPSRRRFWQSLSVRAVWDRSHGICFLCGDVVPRPGTRPDKDPSSASREHLFPAKDGGASVVLAHRRCNEAVVPLTYALKIWIAGHKLGFDAFCALHASGFFRTMVLIEQWIGSADQRRERNLRDRERRKARRQQKLQEGGE